MKMHRAAIHADWQEVSPDSRSAWQQLAAHTEGWVTPGNMVSILGLLLTIMGVGLAIQHQYAWSACLVGVGRLADTLDGAIADRTHTKSRLGEAFDAGIDKIELLAVIVVAVTTQIVSLAIVLAILLPNALISAISLYAKRQRIALHPSRVGKLATAALWGAIWLYLIQQAVTTPLFGHLSLIALVTALIMVFIALSAYARQVIWSREHQPQSTLQR